MPVAMIDIISQPFSFILLFPKLDASTENTIVTDRLKRATHDRANGATKKWLNQSFGEGYFLPFFDLVFNDCFCFFERGFGVR